MDFLSASLCELRKALNWVRDWFIVRIPEPLSIVIHGHGFRMSLVSLQVAVFGFEVAAPRLCHEVGHVKGKRVWILPPPTTSSASAQRV